MSASAGLGERLLRGLLLGGTLAVIVLLFLARWGRPPSPPQNSLPVYGTVADFSLTNQNGQRLTLDQLRGHVWLADIIFTRCPGPCLRLSRQMQSLQQALPADSSVRLVSLTTDAEFDTPPVLQAYATRFAANPQRWFFLTGRPEQIAELAGGSLKLAAVPKGPAEQTTPEDLFIHSTLFVLMDKQARLRGIFETGGEGVDPTGLQARVLTAMAQLEREE